jgi:hypothetical protein
VNLDRNYVVRRQPPQIGDIKRVWGKVALGVTEVRPVKPHVSVICDAIEGEESSAALVD